MYYLWHAIPFFFRGGRYSRGLLADDMCRVVWLLGRVFPNSRFIVRVLFLIDRKVFPTDKRY